MANPNCHLLPGGGAEACSVRRVHGPIEFKSVVRHSGLSSPLGAVLAKRWNHQSLPADGPCVAAESLIGARPHEVCCVALVV
jgi:hypothetical protein